MLIILRIFEKWSEDNKLEFYSNKTKLFFTKKRNIVTGLYNKTIPQTDTRIYIDLTTQAEN